MEQIKDGGPAFPLGANEYGGHGSCFGMTLRDYFAAKAMAGICAHTETWGLCIEEISVHAYKVADAMLSARGARHD